MPVSGSEKKKVSKAKTTSLIEDISAPKGKTEKKKNSRCKYTVRDSDEENGESDSEPSDDNLDDSEFQKIIPKKFQKSKYIRGVNEEKKKKKVEEEPEKKIQKKKTTLMPCMVKAKEARDASKNAKKVESQKKTIKIAKSVVTKIKNDGKHRDVGTQIKYTGDGTQLSLMELDILKHTGCRWSRTIYPGYKGSRY